MPYEVSSWFDNEGYKQTLEPLRRFTIGDSDYSDYVLRWPRFRNSWNAMRPNNITINLSNEDQVFNFFNDDKLNLVKTSKVELGLRTDNVAVTSMGDWDNISSIYWTNSYTLADSNTGGMCAKTDNFDAHPYQEHTRVRWIMLKDTTATSHYPRVLVQRVTSNNSISYARMYTRIDVNTHKVETQFRAEVDTANTWMREFTENGSSFYEAQMSVVWSWDTTFNNSVQVSVTPAAGYASGLTPHALAVGETSFYGFFVDHDEWITLHEGKTDYVRFRDTSVSVAITDKFKQLSERVIGTNDAPVDFTTSDYLPGDLAWWIITSYGGYDTTASSLNTDINYAAWEEWAAIYSDSGVFMQAKFDGQKVTEALRKIGRMTRSAIHIAENKIDFHRFSLVDTHACEVGPDCMTKFEMKIDDADMFNRQYVNADYFANSDSFAITVIAAETPSVNSFGLKEDVQEDKNVWYTDSVGALDLAQRLLLTSGEPYEKPVIETGAKGMFRQVGETVSINWPHAGLAAGYRIMEQELDVERMQAKLTTDRSQLLAGFILDTSSLDGPDILT